MRAVIEMAEADAGLARLLVRNHFLTKARGGPPPALTDVERRVADMDDAGIGISVISVPPPGPSRGDRRTAVRNTAVTNDALIAIAEAFPDRLRVFASLPVPHAIDALAELERVAAHPLVRGLQLMTEASDHPLDLPDMEPIYSRSAELKMPVLLHPALEPLGDAYTDFGLTASLAPLVSSSLGALRLLLSGMLDRVPELDVIIPHLGGVIPYIAQRVVDLSGTGAAQHDVLHYLKHRVFLDTCSHHPPALESALATTPAERILLGSDAPFRGPLRRAVAYVRAAPLDAARQDLVLGANAGRWLP